MKLIDSRKIEGEYLWQATMDGLFLERDGTVKFCYKDRYRVVALSQEGEREVWYTAREGEHLPLPSYWTGVAKGLPPM